MLQTGSTGSGDMWLASSSKTENVCPTTFQVIFEGAFKIYAVDMWNIPHGVKG